MMPAGRGVLKHQSLALLRCLAQQQCLAWHMQCESLHLEEKSRQHVRSLPGIWPGAAGGGYCMGPPGGG